MLFNSLETFEDRKWGIRKKWETKICKTLHRKLQMAQNEKHRSRG